MENDRKTNSLVTKIRYEKSAGANEALAELLEADTEIGGLVEVVLQRMSNGIYFLDDLVTKLIVRSQSTNLYNKVKDRLLPNTRAVIALYQGGINRDFLESILCQRLYDLAGRDGEPLRCEIVEAMAEVGSHATLPLLDSFLFDMTPGTKIHEKFSESFDLLDTLIIRARSEFLKTVERAIERIRGRENCKNSFDDNERLASIKAAFPPSSIRNKAERCIESGLPDIALIVVRRGAEDIAKRAYCIVNGERDGQPARKMMLQGLLAAIKEGSVPTRMLKLLQLFQAFGNLVAHPQDDDRSFISDELAKSIVVLFAYTDEVFTDWAERQGSARKG